MSRSHFKGVLAWLVLCISGSMATAAPQIILPLGQPSNLFTTDQPVRLPVQLKDFKPGQVQVDASVIDYFGRQVWTQSLRVSVKENETAAAMVSIDDLPPGYYELRVKSAGDVSQQASFGVVESFMHRTAAQVRDGGYRFGLKRWNYGNGIGGLQWSEEEAVAASVKLGLQWTREIFTLKRRPGVIDQSLVEMVTDYPMNVVLKVERFPKELYDAERYGPMDEWIAKYGRGWTLNTLPMKEPYQAWLREQIEPIPVEQNVFEIWNEPWNKMPPEDFAVLCQWIAEVILDMRPNAIIGPNLLGRTSPYQFDARFIEAGGMKGMNMVALHPYGKSEDRAWLRDYRGWLAEQTGQPIAIYVTEFGSHSTPKGPAHRTEQDQAQRVVRQALALYAEDVVVFTPHWMGQSERDPTYVEHWFGFFRFNHEPKPVLMAYANAARLIDGSRYVGDLWYGPGSDAMLFERDGVYTLALGTRGEPAHVEVEPGVSDVTVVDMVGGKTRQAVRDGKLSLDVGPDWIYLVGVSPKLEGQASRELRPDRWPEPPTPPRTVRSIHRFSSPPVIDGELDEWQSATQLGMVNPKVMGKDASGIAYLAWDDDYLYVALKMRDNEILNDNPRAKLYREDSIELFVSTDPREDRPGYGPHDHQFFITPTSGEGIPIVAEVVDRQAGKLADVEGARFVVGKAGEGWVAEVALPWSALPGFVPKAGAKAALEMRVNDADSSHERFKIDPIDTRMHPHDPTTWSYMVLEQ